MKPSQDADRTYLGHICDSAQRILDYAEGGRDEFLENQMIQDATPERVWDVIGRLPAFIAGIDRLRG